MIFDSLLVNGTVITVNENFEIIPDGAVGVREGRIVYVGPAAGLPAEHGGRILDARGGLIMPGLVNTHTHLPMSLFRGLADDLELDQWLNSHIFSAEQKHLSPDTVKWGTLLSCAEMLLSGTTTCCDGYFYEDAVAEGVALAGMRGVLGQGVIDFPAPGVPDPGENVANAVRFVKTWKTRSELISPAIFCHSPYTCSKSTMMKAKIAARREGVLFQVHVAETRHEQALIGLAGGVTPVAYLDDLGILDENTLAVHAVWVCANDIAILAKRRVCISHNPESNMKLASGIAPVRDMLAAGLVLGLGTDGNASNNNLDMFSEMDTAAKLHKAALCDPTVIDAKCVIRMATIEGARAIGLGDRIGSLETGKCADIIVVDTRKPHLFPLYHPQSHVVYAARGSDVRHVMVAGNPLVADYRLVKPDIDEVMANVNAVARRIRLTDSGTRRNP